MKLLQKCIRFFFPLLTALSVFFASVFSPAVLAQPFGGESLSVLRYPKEAILSLEQAGLTEQELLDRGSDELPEYVQSGGHSDVNGLIVSPYYTARIGSEDVPVYAAMIYLWSHKGNTAGLHSFSEVYIDPSEPFCFHFELTGVTSPIRNAVVLPESLGLGTVCKNNTMTVSISRPGIYTFLFNGARPEHGYTLFVREKTDDDAEIRRYTEQYGAQNVIVFDRGVHVLDYFSLVNEKDKVVYLRQGAYLIAEHHYDFQQASDDALYEEPGAADSSTLRPRRYAFFGLHRAHNITITGYGVLDMTRLDRGERGGLNLSECSNVHISGIKLINAPGWTLFSYLCSDLYIDNVDILGYRGNSDAFALCNMQNAVVDNCFARSADDHFEVKTLGGPVGSENITYQNCVSWSGYARSFGITGEVNCPIRNVTFRDCAVIWRTATWDNDRIGALVIIAEEARAPIENVTFENIEVFRDEGRAICVKVYDETANNFSMRGIVYRNIRFASYMRAEVEANELDGNTVQVRFENVRANRLDPAESRLGRRMFKLDKKCDVTFA